jgi:hypothetical protein
MGTRYWDETSIAWLLSKAPGSLQGQRHTCQKAVSSLVMNFTIEFFRTRPSDEAHATLDRISIVADNLDAAMVKARSLFDTLDMPQKPDGLRILDQVKRELFVWVPDAHDA